MSVGIADSPDLAGRTKVCERSLCRSKFKVHTGLVSVQLGKVTDLRGKPGPGPSDGFLESGPGQTPRMVSWSLAHLADA